MHTHVNCRAPLSTPHGRHDPRMGVISSAAVDTTQHVVQQAPSGSSQCPDLLSRSFLPPSHTILSHQPQCQLQIQTMLRAALPKMLSIKVSRTKTTPPCSRRLAINKS